MITKTAAAFASPKRTPVRANQLGLKTSDWQIGKYYVEEHDATNLHYDFSLIFNGKVYRMARAKSTGEGRKSGALGVFPGPGETSGWVAQPEHKVSEVPNPAVITDGYGKGTTKVIKTGKVMGRLSTGGNLEIILDGIDGTLAFIETGFPKVLVVRKKVDSPNVGKHVMKDARDITPFIHDDSVVLLAKHDGTAVDWVINKDANGNKHLQIFSYRPDARIEKRYGVRQQIQHTARVPIADKPLSKDVPIAKGRGELWIGGASGFASLSGMLNSHPIKARESGYSPELYIHDIVSHEGSDVSTLPYGSKLELMQGLAKKEQRLKIPEMAKTPQEKTKLFEKAKDDPGFDGVVAWPLDKAGKATKIKYKFDTENLHEATLVDVITQQGEKRGMAYPVLENKFGVRFTAAGKGLDEKTKKDLYSNPDKYIGRAVTYSAEKHFPSGKAWQPVIVKL